MGNTRNAIFTFHFGKTDTFKDDITSQFNREYCRIHGYDFIDIDVLKYDNSNDIHPVWLKIDYAIKLLPLYQYMMWLDSDAGVVNFKIPMEKFIPDMNPPHDFIVQKDVLNLGYHDMYFNLGVFILKNSPFTFKLLKKMMELKYTWPKNDNMREQAALNKLYADDWNGLKKHTYIHDFGTMQSVNHGHYVPGMYIKHLAATGENIVNFKREWYDKLDMDYYDKFGIRIVPLPEGRY